MVRDERPEGARGMKVRSSVKKLCEGCKVGRSFCVCCSRCGECWADGVFG